MARRFARMYAAACDDHATNAEAAQSVGWKMLEDLGHLMRAVCDVWYKLTKDADNKVDDLYDVYEDYNKLAVAKQLPGANPRSLRSVPFDDLYDKCLFQRGFRVLSADDVAGFIGEYVDRLGPDADLLRKYVRDVPGGSAVQPAQPGQLSSDSDSDSDSSVQI